MCCKACWKPSAAKGWTRKPGSRRREEEKGKQQFQPAMPADGADVLPGRGGSAIAGCLPESYGTGEFKKVFGVLADKPVMGVCRLAKRLFVPIMNQEEWWTMTKPKVLVMQGIDNVATATEEISAGSAITVDVDGTVLNIKVTDRIPFGHKVAIRDIAMDEKIIKYGEVIGVATENIKAGQHTHVHNLGGVRGRGDLEQ